MTPQPDKPELAVFFADICRSTSLFEQLGDTAATQLVRRALGVAAGIAHANNGTLVRTKGDDVLCTFTTAADAVATAQQIHEAARQSEEMRGNAVSFRIGVHIGPVVDSGDSIFGDTVNTAARLVMQAKSQQSLLSAAVVEALGGTLDELIRPLGDLSVRGKSGMFGVYELLTPDTEEEVTEVSTAELPVPRSFLLRLRHQARDTRLDPLLVRHLLGRGQDCDLVINHPTVSREHAEIRFDNGRFILRDFSTNGTRVVVDGQPYLVHRSSMQLKGRGAIFLGRTFKNRQLAVEFECIDSRPRRRAGDQL